MYRKVLGYYAQLTTKSYRVPSGLKGNLEKYRIHRSGKAHEIVMMPIGMKIYTFPFSLPWSKKPVLVVHRGETASRKWQVDESVTGLLLASGYDTRETAVAEVLRDLEAIGEDRFWVLHKDVCRALHKGKVPLNKVEAQ